MSIIPGLDVCPTSENESTTETINLVSFSGIFRIPKAQVFGGCRNINDYEKLYRLKIKLSCLYRKCKDNRRDSLVLIKNYIKKKESPGYCSEKHLSALRREIEILPKLQHDNILKFIEPAAKDSIELTYLVFEYCENFLSNMMEKKLNGLFERTMIKYILQQVLLSLDYIHRHKIMHRDVHPKNIMVRYDGCIKLTNFQNAREFTSNDLSIDVTCINYQAPELIFKAKRHGPEIDIWAAGCLLSEFFLMENIFPGSSDCMVMERIANLLGKPNDTVWPEYSSLPRAEEIKFKSSHSYNCLRLYFERLSPQTPQAIDILNKMFCYNPANRIKAEECLRHPYFKGTATMVELSNIIRENRNNLNCFIMLD